MLHRIPRRALLAGLAAAPARLCAAAAQAVVKGVDPQAYLSGRRLYSDLVLYSNMGDHRTATAVDRKTAEWLAGRLQGAGFKVESHPFFVRQFFPEKVTLAVEGKRVESFPLWPVRATGPVPLPAPLAPAAAQGPWTALKNCIALVTFPRAASVNDESGHAELIAGLASAGAVAVIGVTPGETGELVALNSKVGGEPWPVPVAIAGLRDEPMLAAAAGRGATAELLIHGREDPRARAVEVVGRLDRGGRLVVVSTPYSGWFRCAGERGPGIALWLALARWAGRPNARTSYCLVASSGHELDNEGIRLFLQEHAPKPDQVHCWLHLGAGIATFDWETGPGGFRRLDRPSSRVRLMCNRPDLLSVLTRNFALLRHLKPELTLQPVGELRLMVQQGYRAFGLAGPNAYFHAPGDLPERGTAPELLEPVAATLTRTLLQIEAAAAK